MLDDWLGAVGDPDGDWQWASRKSGLAVPRQNGKNAILEIVEMFEMIELGRKILHTAHEVKTARKAFLRLVGFFENREWPHMQSLVANIRKANGQESILLNNGGSVEFVARSRGSARGFTADTIVGDEAQEFTDEQQEALLSTASAAPSGRGRLLLTGTPPGPGVTAEVWPRTRELGVAGTSDRLDWREWSVEGQHVDLDDMGLWHKTNPALGYRLSLDFVQTERESLSDDGFARERLGSWEIGTSSSVIPPELWESCRDPESKRRGPVLFAADLSPDRTVAAIVAAGHRADGLAHLELIDGDRSGTDWVVPRLAELADKHKAKIVIDPGAAAGGWLPDLKLAGVEPVGYSKRQYVQACGYLFDEVNKRRVRHIGQTRFSAAIDAGRKRNLGDAWAWNRRDVTDDITPLVAATLALHELGEPPRKKIKAHFY